ncbi:MAG TPA: PilW family protein [Nitrococcus sp.]|nr:PilW family protein [Nitrococcus sp.]
MTRARRFFPGYAGGFSLVEIMIALTLSLLLLGAVFQIFISAKASYRMNEGLAQIQETGRFATDLLASAIRMAGYQGCMTLDQITPHIIVANPPADLQIYDPANVITGQNDLAASNTLGAVAGSDSLTIRGASAVGARLTGNMSADNANIQIDSNPGGFKQNDILMITDCASADIFRATSVSNSSGSSTVTIAHADSTNTDNRLSKAYQGNARVMQFIATTYFVKDTGRKNEAGDPIYSLYVQRLGGTPVELATGVDSMQVLYGVDTNADGSVDEYVNAGAVTDFTDVISARVALLVRSVEPTSTQPESASYTLLDKTVTTDDRYLRKAFTLTATARNRSLRSTTFN